MEKTGAVIAVCVSASKGMRKTDVGQSDLIAGHGINGDAHAGPGDRQISLLALESIDKMRAAGLDVGPGDFAENIAVKGLDLCSLPIGTVLQIGESIKLEITKIGKVCHDRCEIYYQAGDCVMPREGVFAVVLVGGGIATGDSVRIVAEGCNGG